MYTKTVVWEHEISYLLKANTKIKQEYEVCEMMIN